MRKVLVSALVISSALCACERAEDSSVATDKQSNVSQTASYTIISDEHLRNIKRTVEVRLDEPLTLEEIEKVAKNIHSKDPSYERIFITYYLSGMAVGTGAWATSHFNPNLIIRIMGFEGDEISTESNEDDHQPNNAIGMWLDQSLGIRYILSRKDEKFIMLRQFKDGGTNELELTRPEDTGRRFDDPSSKYGTYYLIKVGGNMDVYDKDGLIETLIKTK